MGEKQTKRTRIIVLSGVILIAAGFLGIRMQAGVGAGARVQDRGVSVIGNQYKAYIAGQATVISDVEYGVVTNDKGQQESLKLDVYLPDSDTFTENQTELAAQKERAAIILVHGGGFTSGDKADSGILKSLAYDYARMGYVVFHVNYRLGDEITKKVMDNAIKDVSKAFSWIQSQSEEYGIDKDTIFVGGHSAGAVISVDMVYSNLFKYRINRNSVAGVIDLAGMRLQMGKAKKGNPECLIIHGTKDATDPFSESEMLKASLDKAKVTCELYPMEGMGHDLSLHYNEVRNKTVAFLYRKITGSEVDVNIVSDSNPEADKLLERMEKNKSYTAGQIAVVLDGNLEEWKDCERISLNQIKDEGGTMPAKEDFAGSVMVAWNEAAPTVLYVAATITDDAIQSANGADGKWYHNDCFEIAFDLSEENMFEQTMKWVVGVNGTALDIMATRDNTEIALIREGNTTTYEMAIDLSKIDRQILNDNGATVFAPGKCMGFSIVYDDADTAKREHQMGWVTGRMSDRNAMGNLYIK